MKLGLKFIKSGISSIVEQSKAIDAKRNNAADRQCAFLESCKKNSSVQQRIDKSRDSIQNKQPSEK